MGSSSNYNVKLSFTADANAAKAEIKSLQTELNKLATGKGLSKDSISALTPEIQKAMTAAGELQARLESAVNVKTGKLDLGKFSDSLKLSGKTLTEYATQLSALGPQGQQAFTQLAQAVIKAETPIIRCSTKLKDLGVAVKNAAKWQISSSAIHSFMGAIQTAYGYAEDLNQSLNNIRIVTGQSISQMDKFAASANKAAKALSATTLDYTNASLIYYQQGLTDQQVKERTDVTIKMANVAQQSATVVSDQMTAIWNNFYDGSKSLEYYADVLVKLGAATASSTDEIAGGLEKFAAIGNAIGLSYEYAAAALATITSNTRQSEEVVGTALKTIFARIQDLELGETLDDGVTLGSYSAALKKVGIEVLDATGEMRDMDDILDDLAAKWDSLNSATKTATAQAVAGTRQYVQLVALMDNWNADDADSMTANLGYTKEATGELDAQADIYAESWEAARDRVTASLEDIYNKLVSDDAFITILNGVSSVIDQVSTLIDSFGGLKGVLFTIGSIVTRVFQQEMAQGLRNATDSILNLTPIGQKKQKEQKEAALNAMYKLNSTVGGETGKALNQSLDHERTMQKFLLDNESKLTAEQKAQLSIQMDLVRQMDKQAESAARTVDSINEEVDAARTLAAAYEKSDAKKEAKEKYEKSHTKEAQEKARQDAEKTGYDDLVAMGKRSKKSNTGNSDAQYASKIYTRVKKGMGQNATEDEIRSEYLAELAKAKDEGNVHAQNLFNTIKTMGQEAADQVQGDLVNGLNEAMDQAEKAASERAHLVFTATDQATMTNVRAKDLRKTVTNMVGKEDEESFSKKNSDDVKKMKDTASSKLQAIRQEVSDLKESFKQLGDDAKLPDDFKNMDEELGSWQEKLDKNSLSAKELYKILKEIAEVTVDEKDLLGKVEDASENAALTAASQLHGGEATKDPDTLTGKDFLASQRLSQARMNEENANKNVSDTLGGVVNVNIDEVSDWADTIVRAGQAVLTLGNIITTVQGVIDVFTNPDATGWDKFTAIIGAAISIVSAMAGVLQVVKTSADMAGMSMKEFWSSALGPALAVVVAIAAVTAAIIGLKEILHKTTDEERLEQLNESVESLGNSLNEATAAAQSLKETISSYDEAVTALEGLNSSSQEYADSLEAANKKAKELIETYGLWNDYTYQNGLITFNDGVLDNLQATKDSIVTRDEQNLRFAQVQQQIVAANIANEKASENFIQNRTSSKDKDILKTFVSGSGAMANNEEEVTNKLLDQLSTKYGDTGSYSAEAIADILKNAIQERSDNEMVAQEEFSDEEILEAAEHIAPALNDMVDSMSEYSDKIKYQTKELAQSFLTEKFGEKFTEAAKDSDGNVNATLVDAQARAVEALTAEATKSLQKEINVSEKTSNKSMQAYATNDDISEETIKAVFGDQYTKADLKDLFADDEELGLTYAAMISGIDRDKLTYKGGWGVGTVKDAEGKTLVDAVDDKVMRREIAMAIETEQLKQNYFGDTSTQEQSDIIAKLVENRDIASEKYGVDFTQSILDGIANNSDEFDFSSLFAEIDPDEIQELTGLSNEGILELLGITQEDLDALNYDSNDFIAKFKTGLESWTYTLDTSKLEANTKTIQDAVKNLTEGSIIQEETYTKLKELDIDVDNYFTKMADGTYKLTNAAKDFLALVNGGLESSYLDKILENEKAIAFAQKNAIKDTDVSAGALWAQTAIFDGMGTRTHNVTKARVDFLKQLDAESYGFSADQVALLSQDAWNYEDMEAIRDMMQMVSEKADELQGQFLSLSGSVAELDSNVQSLLDNGQTVNYMTYAEALVSLGSQYENCTEEIARFQKALLSGNTETLIAAQTSLSAAILAGELAAEYGLTSTELERYAEELQITGKYENANQTALVQMAKDQKRYDNAIISASNNMEDWIQDLKVAEKTGYLVSETATEMAAAYGDLLDIDGDTLSASFLHSEQNLKDMQLALEGNVEAYERLQEAARKDIALKVGFDDEQFQNDFNELLYDAEINFPNLEVGMDLDDDEFLNKLSTLLTNAKMTAEEAESYLSAMGIDATVVNSTQTVPETVAYDLVAVPGTVKQDYNPGASSDGSTATYPTVEYVPQPVTVPRTISGQALEIKSASKSSGGDVKFKGSTPAQGGSNKTAKNKTINFTKKSDTVKRYKKIDDAIEDNTQAMNRASDAADRLYGKARIEKMEKVNELIQEEVALNKQKREEALAYLKQDKGDLQDAASAAGYTFTFDEDGDITNYQEVMTALWKELHAAESSAMADNNVTDEESEKIEAIEKKISNVKEALEQYEETKGIIEDLDEAIQDAVNEWQDNNLEIFEEGFELEFSDAEEQLEELEYYMKKVEDDAYELAEAFGWLGSIVELNRKNYDTYNEQLTQLSDLYKTIDADGNRAISDSAYMEKLKEMQSNILSASSTLQEKDKEMMAYYGDALSTMSDEVDKYTSRFDDLNSVLDHYTSLMDIMGKSKNYQAMNQILKTQADISKNQADIATQQYESYKAGTDYWKDLMETAKASGDEAAAEAYEQNYDAAYEKMVAAQDNMYEKTQEWLEKMKELYENQLAELGENLQKALTGGVSFDTLTTAMDRASSLQEEYLTTTNKIYETNKLMRTAQQEIDKSTNSVAKKRLAAFVNETQQLQDQTKLSNYELQIQQAKYDLLLAEIALQEAQDAKSTVRLKRDSEGNLGYVYTADSAAISEAEQNLADKQNSLYNIALEGANNYTEKYSQTMNDMYEVLSELHEQYLSGEIKTEDEYNEAVRAAKEYYYQQLEDYSSLYRVAVTTDSRVIADAWSSDFSSMVNDTENLKLKVDEYTASSAEVLKNWSSDVQQAVKDTNLDQVEQDVKNIKSASEELRDFITDSENGLLKVMEEQEVDIRNISKAYADQRTQIGETITAYENLIKRIKDYKDAVNSNPSEGASYVTENMGDIVGEGTGFYKDSSSSNSSSSSSSSKGIAAGSYNNGTVSEDDIKGLQEYLKVAVDKKYGQNTQDAADRAFGGTDMTAAEAVAAWKIALEKEAKKQAKNTGVIIAGGGAASVPLYKQLTPFDTGGYTGEWGSYGKLAMLHQKELVLNAGDTENFLASMELLDHILEVIDLQSTSARLGGLLTSPGVRDNDSTIEQNVHIEASFPNVQNHSEIEEAFNNLINQASQYANRK